MAETGCKVTRKRKLGLLPSWSSSIIVAQFPATVRRLLARKDIEKRPCRIQPRYKHVFHLTIYLQVMPKTTKGGFYAVNKGREPGVYLTWYDAQEPRWHEYVTRNTGTTVKPKLKAFMEQNTRNSINKMRQKLLLVCLYSLLQQGSHHPLRKSHPPARLGSRGPTVGQSQFRTICQ